ncbi:MAG: 30S ribosomal protein S6 [Clostridia bacterium]|nr:30S ribosomal protein S6 [Clostridia bacterium]
MEKISSYETLFIVDAQQGEDGVKALIEKFTNLIAANGTIESVNEWGKRKLAYPINDLTEGYYVLVEFKSAPTLPLELERVFGITDGIMRSIVIKHDEKKAAKKAAAPAAEEAAPAAEAAPAEAEAPAADAE